MKNILSLEMNRAVKNRRFFLSIMIGLAITVSHFFTSVLPSVRSLDNYLYGKGEFPVSVFNTWIGGEGHSVQPSLFYILVPILCCFPYAGSLYTDIKCGYQKNLFIRTTKSKYYASKFIVNFLIAGITICFPLLVNLLLTAMVLPSLTPQLSSMQFPLGSLCMWNTLFYTNPYLYIGLFFIIIFCISGLIASISLILSFFAKNQIIVLLVPFILCQLDNFICNYWGKPRYSLLNFIRPNQPCALYFSIIVEMFIAIMVMIALIYCYKGSSNETF